MHSTLPEKLAVIGWLALLLTLPLPAHAEFVVLYHELPAQLSFDGPDLANAHRKAARTGASASRLHLQAFGQAFELTLTPNERVRSALASGQRLRDVELYRGELAGSAHGWARIARAGGRVYGALWDGAELYVIAPLDQAGLSAADRARYGDRSADTAIIYRWSDTRGRQLQDLVPHLPDATPLVQSGKSLASPVGLEKSAPTRRIDIGVIADSELADEFPQADELMLAQLNVVDGIFAEQVGVQINVAQIEILAPENDPFTASDASGLLNQIAARKDASARSLAALYLFTARTIDGDLAGAAYLSQICAPSLGVGFTRIASGFFSEALITAHEFGHLLGAPHDAESGSACQTTPADFLMAARINRSEIFSACSLAQMQPVVANAQCMQPVLGSDATVSAGAPPGEILLGERFTQEFIIDAVGTTAVYDVVATVTTGPGLEVVNATIGGSFCEIDAGDALCRSSRIADGAAQMMRIEFRTTASGLVTAEIGVSASNDTDASNNTISVQFETVPAADLLIELSAAPGWYRPGETAELIATVRNAGFAESANTRLSISAGASELERLSFNIPNCQEIDSLSFVCELGTLAAQETRIFSLQAVPADWSGSPNDSRTHEIRMSIVGDARELSVPNSADVAEITSVHSLVDLRVELSARTDPLRVGEAAVLSIALVNDGPDEATNARFRGQFQTAAAGWIRTVTASTGHCEILPGAEIVECDFERIAPFATPLIDVEFVPDRVAPEVYFHLDATIEGAGFDMAPANDSRSERLSVAGELTAAPAPARPPDPDSGSGGGGALGLGWLGLLSLLLRRRLVARYDRIVVRSSLRGA